METLPGVFLSQATRIMSGNTAAADIIPNHTKERTMRLRILMLWAVLASLVGLRGAGTAQSR